MRADGHRIMFEHRFRITQASRTRQRTQRWLPRPLYVYCMIPTPSLLEAYGTSMTKFENSDRKAQQPARSRSRSTSCISQLETKRVLSKLRMVTLGEREEANKNCPSSSLETTQKQFSWWFISARSSFQNWQPDQLPFSIVSWSLRDSTCPDCMLTISQRVGLTSSNSHSWAILSFWRGDIPTSGPEVRYWLVLRLRMRYTVPLCMYWTASIPSRQRSIVSVIIM